MVSLRRLGGLVAIVTAVSCLATGCTSSDGDAGNELRIGATAMPDSMDPTASNTAAIPEALLYNVYETLVKLDSDGKIRPLLAKEWTVSNDLLTYTFTLQPEAKFASGDKVDAQAVVQSVERVQNDSAVTSTNKAELDLVTSVQALDDERIEFKLAQPSNSWLYSMTGTAGIVFDPSGFDNLATATAGSGPYQLGEWRQGESVRLVKNENYWGTPARFDAVTFRYFADANALNSAMLSGDLDIVTTITAPQALDQFSDTSKYQVIEGTTNAEIVLGFNHSRTPLNDVRVRQAINYAIDRQALVNSVWAGYGTLIGSMVPPTDPWYEDLSGAYSYDPAKAKELLTEAGYADGLALNLRIPSLPYATGAAQFIVSQLGEVGITVTVDELEFPARWLDEVYTNANYDMTIVAHAEPHDISHWADPSYYWKYNNPQFADLLTQADSADSDHQVELMKQAAHLLSDDAAADFLWLLPSLVVAKADILGLPTNQVTRSFDVTTLSRS